VLLVVGRIGRPHGVLGDVAVDVRTDSPEERFAPGCVLVTDPAERGPLTVQSARAHSGRLLVHFAGADDRDAAEALKGTTLMVDSEQLPEPDEPDVWHDHQLLDLAVETVGGQPVGTVADVLHVPAQDLLVVRRDDGSEVLVPFVSEIVPEVDVPAGRIRIEPPPGLLEEGLG
jgi:16S rRNA processing protein RimM